MKIKYYFLYIIIFLFCLPAKADFINKIRPDQCETIIEVYVEDGQIRVTYEVGLKDWKYFKEIIPNELLNDDIREYINSQGKNYFYNNVFTLKADGKILIGNIVKQEVMPRIYRASIYTGEVDKNNPHILANIDVDKVFDQVMKTEGDAKQGAKLFLQQSCVACHTYANGQQPKGPHLVDIGKRYKKEELIESILKPDAKIAQGFDTYTFVTDDGKVVPGFVVSESAETLTLRKNDGLSAELVQDDIDERAKQKISMMPKGVVNNLTPEQLADLIAYLQTLK